MANNKLNPKFNPFNQGEDIIKQTTKGEANFLKGLTNEHLYDKVWKICLAYCWGMIYFTCGAILFIALFMMTLEGKQQEVSIYSVVPPFIFGLAFFLLFMALALKLIIKLILIAIRKDKKFKIISVSFFALISLVVGGTLVMMFGNILAWNAISVAQDKMIVCQMDSVKLCFDGSQVIKVPPNCEYAKCPGEGDGDPREKFYDMEHGVRFKYFVKLPTNFMHAVEWPPRVTVSDGRLFCSPKVSESGSPELVVSRTIDSRVYCVVSSAEGAAGSIYTNYVYTTEKGGKVISVSFTIQAVQCSNYDDPDKTTCQLERETFNLDEVVDSLVTSMNWDK